MIKMKKLIRNIIILSVLILLINIDTPFSFTPLAAHKRSEKSANYGPSVIIKTQSLNGKKLYLCKYDKWFSLDTVQREFLGLWFPGDGPYGIEADTTKAIDYYYRTDGSNNHRTYEFFGKVNDKKIKSVSLEIELNGNPKKLELNKLYEDLFMFVFEEDNKLKCEMKVITGYDSSSNILFEKKID